MTDTLEAVLSLQENVTAYVEASDAMDTVRGAQIIVLTDEVTELRDGLAALSHRIDSLTQLVIRGDHGCLDLPTRKALHDALAEEFGHSRKVEP